MSVEATFTLSVTKITPEMEVVEADDMLAAEEPLEIRLEYGPASNRHLQNVAVTMRTPGHDIELATGFLFTEGIIDSSANIHKAEHSFIVCAENRENTIQIALADDVQPNLHKAERNFYTTSSCGVCGKSSINAIRTVSGYTRSDKEPACITASVLNALPEILNHHQQVFAATGGLHASALFTLEGDLVLAREDVGRHNALDKLIGAALQQSWLPLNRHVLLLSGRASFELIQKAAMAGIRTVAAVGAPSTLAVQLAEEFDITLIGFLRSRRFNIYTAPHRVIVV